MLFNCLHTHLPLGLIFNYNMRNISYISNIIILNVKKIFMLNSPISSSEKALISLLQKAT